MISSCSSRGGCTSAPVGPMSTPRIVERLKRERVARLQEFPELSDDIVKAVG